jgi:hypothetical protein
VKRIAIEKLMNSGMALAKITAMLRLCHRRLVQLAALCFVPEHARVRA